MIARFFRLLLVLAGAASALAQAGEITLYTRSEFAGREVTLRDVTPDLAERGFDARAASLVVRSGRWELCTDAAFRGRCEVFERGEYRQLAGADGSFGSAREVGTGRHAWAWPKPHGARGAIELFTGRELSGNSTLVLRNTDDFVQIGFNDRARSMLVTTGTWKLCSDARYRGQCRVFGPGRYPDLGLELVGRVSSARLLTEDELKNPLPELDPGVPVLLYAEAGLRGRSQKLKADTPDLAPLGFDDAAASLVIQSGTWELCAGSGYRAPCRVLGPGVYRTLDGALLRGVSSLRMVAPPGGPARPAGEVELFSDLDFGGARLPLRGPTPALDDLDFDKRARSIIVHRGDWEFCVEPDFGTPCVVYGPGRYDRLGSLSGQISSLRRVR